MSDESALLRAICEHPDDDTPRLVFADWLTEQGGAVNVAWANGIRAEVWLARGAGDAAAVQQSRVFESSYGRAKVRERMGLPPGLDVIAWERGFPASATAHFRELRDAWPHLAFRVPLRRLTVFGASAADAEEFATWPALTVLGELEFCAAWETPSPPDVVPALAKCEPLHNLKSLTLRYALFNEATVTAVLDSPHLAGLEVLRLDIDRDTPALSRALKDRLVARFGEKVFDDTIPF